MCAVIYDELKIFRTPLQHCTLQTCAQGLRPWTPLGALPPDPLFSRFALVFNNKCWHKMRPTHPPDAPACLASLFQMLILISYFFWAGGGGAGVMDKTFATQ